MTSVVNNKGRYVELDLGQPRFSLSGTLGIYELSNPLHTYNNKFVSLFGEGLQCEYLGHSHPSNIEQTYINTSIELIQRSKSILNKRI